MLFVILSINYLMCYGMLRDFQWNEMFYVIIYIYPHPDQSNVTISTLLTPFDYVTTYKLEIIMFL